MDLQAGQTMQMSIKIQNRVMHKTIECAKIDMLNANIILRFRPTAT